MSLTDDIRKNLDNDFARAVDKAICNGAYDTIMDETVSENTDNNTSIKDNASKKKHKSKKVKINSIYGTDMKSNEIIDQLVKIINMVKTTSSDNISIDIKIKTLTSKQRYKHKGSRTKCGLFD